MLPPRRSLCVPQIAGHASHLQCKGKVGHPVYTRNIVTLYHVCMIVHTDFSIPDKELSLPLAWSRASSRRGNTSGVDSSTRHLEESPAFATLKGDDRKMGWSCSARKRRWSCSAGEEEAMVLLDEEEAMVSGWSCEEVMLRGVVLLGEEEAMVSGWSCEEVMLRGVVLLGEEEAVVSGWCCSTRKRRWFRDNPAKKF